MMIIEKITVPVVIIAVLMLAFTLFDKMRRQNHKKILKELKKASADKAHGVLFGKLGRKIIFSPTGSEGSIAVFAASGTGKTSAIGIPTLRSWTGTSFTIDISGDICKNCPDMPNKIIYEPEDPDTTPYNIFGAIDDLKTTEDKNEALEQLAFLLIPEVPNMNENARYFLTNGRKILTASLIAFYGTGMDFIPICKKVAGSSYPNLFQAIDETKNEDAITYINSFEGVSAQNISGCKQSCDDAIKLFATNGKIKKSVRRPTESEKSIEGKMIEKYNIFVIIGDPKIELYSPLLNIITSLQMQYISNRKVTDESENILLFLDEYASLKIDAGTILEALRKYRKRLCRVMIMTQNLADLDILYGHDTTKALMANFRFKVLLGGLGEPESQKYFAELIGYKNAIKKSTSKSSTRTTQTKSESKEYIIEPADLDKQGPDTVILIHPDNEGYILLKKNFYYK